MDEPSKKSLSNHLTDTHQTFWQLAIIQLAGWTSLPILATSIIILQNNSFYGSIMTIIIGNAIVWFVRLGIIAMARKDRRSTMDLAKIYFGNFGSYFIAILLLISTVSWFVTQTTTASKTLTRLINIVENPAIDQFSQVSVLLGMVSAFLCMEGMVLLRKISTICFPILLIIFFIIIFQISDPTSANNYNSFSLTGLTLVLSTNLGITSDLPTFFRHSQSWSQSIKALTVIQIFSLALGVLSLYFGSFLGSDFGINDQYILNSKNEILRFSLIIFVFLSVICANVANVYSASVGWELVAPSALIGRKEYLILGLVLTTIFILFSNIFPIDLMLNISDSSMVNLCIVFILAFLITGWQRKSPDLFKKWSYFAAWLVSSLINLLQACDILSNQFSTVFLGFITIAVTLFSLFGLRLLLHSPR